jgi:phthalate 4,5-dioxygenase oxygenase subunit
LASVIVPRSDTSSYFHFIAWAEGEQAGIDTEAWRRFCVLVVGEDVDAHFRPIKRHAHNDYLQDRAAMENCSFTGISGIPNQDIAMWESMGPIGDRSKERVGVSDIAVSAFRRLMVEAARAMRDGRPAIGTTELDVRHASIGSFEGVVPKTIDWRTLGGCSERSALNLRPATV